MGWELVIGADAARPDEAYALGSSTAVAAFLGWAGGLPAGDYPALAAFAAGLRTTDGDAVARELAAARGSHPPGDEGVEAIIDEVGESLDALAAGTPAAIVS